MSQKRASLAVERQAAFTQVSLVDREILGELQIRQIGEELSAVVRASPGAKLLLHFGAVERLSSMALGMLTIVYKRALDVGVELKFSNIRPEIRRVFAISRLDQVFDIHEDASGAIAAFGRAAK
jgi:anti-anti-sigma factor